MSKEEYMEEIHKLLQECNDIPLIDLVHKLLTQSL